MPPRHPVCRNFIGRLLLRDDISHNSTDREICSSKRKRDEMLYTYNYTQAPARRLAIVILAITKTRAWRVLSSLSSAGTASLHLANVARNRKRKRELYSVCYVCRHLPRQYRSTLCRAQRLYIDGKMYRANVGNDISESCLRTACRIRCLSRVSRTAGTVFGFIMLTSTMFPGVSMSSL